MVEWIVFREGLPIPVGVFELFEKNSAKHVGKPDGFNRGEPFYLTPPGAPAGASPLKIDLGGNNNRPVQPLSGRLVSNSISRDAVGAAAAKSLGCGGWGVLVTAVVVHLLWVR